MDGAAALQPHGRAAAARVGVGLAEVDRRVKRRDERGQGVVGLAGDVPQGLGGRRAEQVPKIRRGLLAVLVTGILWTRFGEHGAERGRGGACVRSETPDELDDANPPVKIVLGEDHQFRLHAVSRRNLQGLDQVRHKLFGFAGGDALHGAHDHGVAVRLKSKVAPPRGVGILQQELDDFRQRRFGRRADPPQGADSLHFHRRVSSRRRRGDQLAEIGHGRGGGRPDASQRTGHFGTFGAEGVVLSHETQPPGEVPPRAPARRARPPAQATPGAAWHGSESRRPSLLPSIEPKVADDRGANQRRRPGPRDGRSRFGLAAPRPETAAVAGRPRQTA